MDRDFIELKTSKEVYDYLDKKMIITLQIDKVALNIAKVRKLGRDFLVIQNYGEYPYDLTLSMLLSRYNVRAFIYRNPAPTVKDDTIEFLINFWLRRGW